MRRNTKLRNNEILRTRTQNVLPEHERPFVSLPRSLAFNLRVLATKVSLFEPTLICLLSESIC